MAAQRLLSLLEELTDEEFRKFLFLLPGRAAPIPRGKLDGASRVRLAQLLLQYCPGAELGVAARLLEAIPRRDLLEKYRLQGREESPPRAEAAASHLQEQQFLVNEKTREANARRDTLAETGPVPRQVSEKELMKLAKNLGKKWKAIGVEYLGVAISCLEQIEEENPGNAVMRNFYMLKVWKNCEGEKATPDRLYHILAQEEVPLDQDAIMFLKSS